LIYLLGKLQDKYIKANLVCSIVLNKYFRYLGEYEKIWEDDVEGFIKREAEGRKKYKVDEAFTMLIEAEINLIYWAGKNVSWFPGFKFGRQRDNKLFLKNEQLRNYLLDLAMQLKSDTAHKEAHLTASLASKNGKMSQTDKKE
jgi:hypothetical protein